MRFNRSVAALAIVFAASSFGGHTTFAETKPSTPNTETTKSEQTKKEEPVIATVNDGDTLSSIADTYHTTWVRIFNANENVANPDVINAGDKLRIPKDDEQLTDRYSAIAAAAAQAAAAQVQAAPVVAAPATTTAAPAATASSAAVATTTTTGRVSAGHVGNRYAWGNCTWYVYNRKPNLGSFWGNGGYGWLSAAQAAGFATGSAPVAGAIGVEAGHVVIIESVNGNGTVNLSEMNYAGGLGQIHYRTAPASEFMYIYA